MSIEPPITDPTPDTAEIAEIAVPRRSRRGLPVLVALLAVAALAASVLTRMMPGLPARSPVHSADQLPEEIVVDGLVARAEAAVLEHVVLQLDDSTLCPWPDCTASWGHVPEFTLFDDGHVVYMDAQPSDPSGGVVRAAAPSPEAMALLTEQVDQLVRGHAPQLADGDPCPAANGCPGALIVRVRRDGVLRTFAISEGPSDDASKSLVSASDLLRDWSSDSDMPLSTLMVVVPNPIPDEWHGETPPPTWVGPASADMPAMVDRVLLDAFALSSDIHDYKGTSPLTATLSQDDPGYLKLPAPQFQGVDDATVLRPRAWYFTTGVIGDPIIYGGDHGEPQDISLFFVPWIYLDVDLHAMLDIYREAHRNAVTARAWADATAVAALPHDVAITDVAEPVTIIRPPTPTPFPTAPAVTWTGDGSPQLPAARGIQTWMQWYRYDEDRAALTRLRQAGFEWFKQRYAWADLQPTGSQGFDATNSDLYIQTVNDLGGRVIIQLAVPPAWAIDAGSSDPFNLVVWRQFVDQFAQRYRGEVAAYEIMNEPNLAREWGGEPDPSAYARVLGAAYGAIKSVDPHAVVISAGLAPTGDRMPEAMGDETYLNGLYDTMGHSSTVPGSFFDALGVHAAGFKAAPDVSPGAAAADATLGGDRTFTFRHIEDLRSLMDVNADDRPFVITEFGWTTDPRPDSPYHWMAVDAATRGQHIAQAFAMGPTLLGGEGNVGPMILFSAADRAWTPDEEAFWWAVADADGHVDGAVREALDLGGE